MDKAILQEFEAIGVDLDSESLGKCCEICTVHNITDAEEFVEQWMAYSLTKFNGAEPTVARLTEFQLKGYAKEQESVQAHNDDYRSHAKRSRVSNASSILNAYGFDDTIHQDSHDRPFGQANGPGIAKAGKGGAFQDAIPSNANNKENENGALLSATTTTSTPSAGQVVFNFGKAKKSADSKRSTPLLFELLSGMAADEKYLFEMIPEKANYQREMLYNLGKEFTDKVKFQDSQKVERFSSVDQPSQQTVHCIGRICTEGDTKLSPNSTVLIGTDSDTMRKVSVNFSKCPSYAVFPGQSVYMTGLNPNGTMFYADHVHAERDIGVPTFPSLAAPLDVVMAAGPFSDRDNLKYSGLDKLLSFCEKNKPDLLILMGPFVDEGNSQMEILNEGHDVFFEKMVANIMNRLKESSDQTKVVMIASQDDLNSSASYPTHPLTVAGANYPNLKLLPDPCQFSIDGITFAFTATDILQHLSDAELVHNSGADKVRRHVRQLFHQKSFYPLSPAHEGVNLDVGLLSKFGRIKTIPNVIVLPSASKPFVRLIDGCLAVNPGKTNPSYARLIVNPKPKEDSNLMEFVSCQVINL